jgi:acylphosphatase
MIEPEKIRYTVRVSGRVQGVGFRYSAVNTAKRLQISGYIKNMPDGSVYLEIEGAPDNVRKMLAWCYQGPRTAWIDQVNEYKEPPKDYKGFGVKY